MYVVVILYLTYAINGVASVCTVLISGGISAYAWPTYSDNTRKK